MSRFFIILNLLGLLIVMQIGGLYDNSPEPSQPAIHPISVDCDVSHHGSEPIRCTAMHISGDHCANPCFVSPQPSVLYRPASSSELLQIIDTEGEGQLTVRHKRPPKTDA